MSSNVEMIKAGSGRANIAFSNALFDVMDDLEYRRISSPEDFEAIGHLRQKAFDKYEIYERKFGQEVIEDIDFDPLTHVFGIYYRGELVSTIRTKRVSADSRDCGAIKLFSSVLNSMLDQGLTFVDPGRLAIDQEFTKLIPGLHILTTRMAVMSAIHQQVDFLLFACKYEHAAFYRRIGRATMLAGPISSPGMLTRSVLLGNSTDKKHELFERYPVFRYTDTEARLLFDGPAAGLQHVSVKPTARLAFKVA